MKTNQLCRTALIIIATTVSSAQASVPINSPTFSPHAVLIRHVKRRYQRIIHRIDKPTRSPFSHGRPACLPKKEADSPRKLSREECKRIKDKLRVNRAKEIESIHRLLNVKSLR